MTASEFSAQRYERMTYRRCGRSGLMLPAISIGCWHNFEDVERGRALLRRSFDLGINHFDLANNYGPPAGMAETNVGRILAEDFAAHRDELIVSTKAGYRMWPGPYGDGGSRKYLVSSLDQSLRRLKLDYVDIFYSHRFDANTPLEETMGALDQVVRQGKALYAGISSYSADATRHAATLLAARGTPLSIHQPSYNMFERWVEKNLLGAVEDLGVGLIAFCPLAQGLLTDKYLKGIPQDSRAASVTGYLREHNVTADVVAKAGKLNAIAQQRGQTLAQMALAWLLKDRRVTSVLIGASKVSQIEDNVAALAKIAFTAEELAQIESVLTA
ncbi:MAG: L-glyceraldehyde 3-phosphate reductase [Phycisphaeraceae bacterium]|nr:L-glyceraldehyde 3-phosphate reductase [Phycisphaeraceae bacterium]